MGFMERFARFWLHRSACPVAAEYAWAMTKELTSLYVLCMLLTGRYSERKGICMDMSRTSRVGRLCTMDASRDLTRQEGIIKSDMTFEIPGLFAWLKWEWLEDLGPFYFDFGL